MVLHERRNAIICCQYIYLCQCTEEDEVSACHRTCQNGFIPIHWSCLGFIGNNCSHALYRHQIYHQEYTVALFYVLWIMLSHRIIPTIFIYYRTIQGFSEVPQFGDTSVVLCYADCMEPAIFGPDFGFHIEAESFLLFGGGVSRKSAISSWIVIPLATNDLLLDCHHSVVHCWEQYAHEVQKTIHRFALGVIILSETAIKIENMWKEYPMFKSDRERLRTLFSFRYMPRQFTALADINLEFKKGEIIGMLGLNGSGKSTLASIITGITYPNRGKIEVTGEVNMLSANAGMENHLTGLENIRYKGLLMGLNDRQISAIRDDIIEFADIGEHIEQPLRTYSSGMRSRLGFAISVHMNPDILIIDEALAVGDNSFSDKCLAKMDEFKQEGRTILFVSHAVTQMESVCDRVMWLHRGTVLGIDKPDKLIAPYCGFAREFNAMTNTERAQLTPTLTEYQEKYLRK